MKHIIQLLAVVLLLFSTLQLKAQVIYFDGLGRAIVSNQAMEGEALAGDTSSPRQTIGGYTLFDLGVNIMPNRMFNAHAVLRARNEFGGFFGSSSLLSFREVQLEGIVKKGIYYELGDIDVELTPYTVFNNDEMYHSFEASSFARRRDILHYENFNNGNQWRLQGARTEMSFKPYQLLSEVRLNVFATRTRPSNNINTPDRFLLGGQLGFDKDSLIEVNLNYTGFTDNPSSEDVFDYSNHVFTVSGDVFIMNSEEKRFFVSAEAGISKYSFDNRLTDSLVAFDDYFYDAAVNFEKDNLLSAKFGYREVGPQFSSPSAQTQRINPNSTPLMFTQVQSGNSERSALAFDRLAQEGLYNASISPVLFTTLPVYSNVNPYGVATPNRRGFYVNVSGGDTSTVIRAEVNLGLSGEIIGEGTTEKRKFTTIYGGVEGQLHKLLDWNKSLLLTVGGRLEKTTRVGNAEVDLNSLLIDAGIEVEVISDLFIDGGVKLLNASGTEFLGFRDGFNGLSSFEIGNYDQSEQLVALGARYSFGKGSDLGLNYYSVVFKDDLNINSSYSINQLFINYTLQF